MVLMSAGKRARNQASIVNRPTCGGNKKAGLISYISIVNARATGKTICNTRFTTCLDYPLWECPKSYREGAQNQLTSGTVGRTGVLATRGRGGFVMSSF